MQFDARLLARRCDQAGHVAISPVAYGAADQEGASFGLL